MPVGSTNSFDPEHGSESFDFVNETDIDVGVEEVMDALVTQHPELVQETAILQGWGREGRGRAPAGLFNRDKFVTPRGVFAEMKLAQEAAESDDVISGIVETTEQLALNRVVVETGDEDEDDIWRQILEDIDLAARMREIWREVFVTSNCYTAVLMGKGKDYKVKGSSENGNKRKKTYSGLTVPLGLSVLDPLQVIPVGNFMFGKERLVYSVDRGTGADIRKSLAGKNTSDLVVTELIEKEYVVTPTERTLIQEDCGTAVALDHLFLLNEAKVFKITATRPAYTRFAAVRMRSVFELLDTKQQLRQMDRAHLIGATNFIIVVKKGTDALPARPGEVAQLANQMKAAARIPVLIGDHRITVEIITPKLDKTLSPERYNSIDSRITARLYQIFNAGNYAAGSANDDSLKLIRVVSRSMEARRNLIRDQIMKYVIMPTFEANDSLKGEPKLKFYPSRINLDFDPNVALYLQDLRTEGDLSRHTALAELDIDEGEEARWREKEKKWDKLFVPPSVLNAPKPVAGAPGAPGAPGGAAPQGKTPTAPGQKGAGRRGGGNSNGGGTNQQSPRSGPARGPAKPPSKLKAHLDAQAAAKQEDYSDDTYIIDEEDEA